MKTSVLFVLGLFVTTVSAQPNGMGPEQMEKQVEEGQKVRFSYGQKSATKNGAQEDSVEKRRAELAELACKGLSRGTPCSFNALNGRRLSGTCARTDQDKPMFCRANSYQPPPPKFEDSRPQSPASSWPAPPAKSPESTAPPPPAPAPAPAPEPQPVSPIPGLPIPDPSIPGQEIPPEYRNQGSGF